MLVVMNLHLITVVLGELEFMTDPDPILGIAAYMASLLGAASAMHAVAMILRKHEKGKKGNIFDHLDWVGQAVALYYYSNGTPNNLMDGNEVCLAAILLLIPSAVRLYANRKLTAEWVEPVAESPLLNGRQP